MNLKKIKDFFALERNVVVIVFANMFWACHYLWKEFEPKFYESLGASIPTIGVLFSLTSISYAIASLFGGHLSDFLGRKFLVTRFYLIGSFTLLALYFVPNWIFLIPIMIVSGITAGLGDPGFQTLLSESLPKKKRATGQSVVYLSGTIISIAIIPIGAWVVQNYNILQGTRINLLFSFILSVAGSIIFLLFIRETLRNVKKSKIRFHFFQSIKFLRDIPKKIKIFLLLISVTTFTGALTSTYWIFYAFDVIQIQPLQWGILGSIQFISVSLVIFLGGKLSDKYGRRSVLLISFAFAVLTPILFIFSKSFFHLVLVNILIGVTALGSSSIFPYIVDNTEVKFRAKTMGIIHSLMSIATIPAPIIGGLLYSFMPQFPFILTTIIYIPIFLISFKFLSK
jgi:MFS family permease